MVFTRILRNLIRDKELGPRIVPIIPDEARTFGMDPLFKEVGIYAALGQRYEPVDSDLVLSYREATDGQVLEEGITEAGSMASFQAAGTSYATHGHVDDPVLHLLLDVRLPADRRPDVGVRGCPRSRLPHGRDGRSHHAGGRGPAARRRPQPHPRLDGARRPRLRPGLRLRARRDRPRRDRAHVRQGRGRLLLHHALQRELRPAARSPTASTRGSCAASTGSPRRRSSARTRIRPGSSARAPSSTGSSRRATCWPRRFGVAAEVYSAPSFPLLRRDALEAERWNRLHPDAKDQRVPYVTTVLPGDGGPIVAATDWMKALPDMVARWLPRAVRVARDGRVRPKRHARGPAGAVRDRPAPHRGRDPRLAGALRRHGPGQGGQGDPRARHRPRQDRSARRLSSACRRPRRRRRASSDRLPAERTDRAGPARRVFLRLGLTSFGGPAAHVALMRDEFVRRRGWLDDAAFVDLLGAANLIPGPTSTELAMHLGHRRARPGRACRRRSRVPAAGRG